jgi:molybdopterin converting factor small subunit
MQITIQAFGIARDILKASSVNMDIDEDMKVSDVKVLLKEKYPDFELLASLQLAVNTEYVGDDFQLSSNDEIVLIPPVSGG